ncbi:alpha-hydroxy-acid oxidizing protein [Pseudooceanicola nanhaiensis]|uniref:alpha-hydroxy-acid oxidizing protein n=1 Tax=Pseudooceanicola nanhaiensis TaxID=375761 RepID=UPI001CD59719|nr:alpha-hydroxy-acid oxidizing protein [Pseudooceanicola nanhaiensis]MCA0921448.1 alpha-hydroxy-acid oxidizing protein [Pseudooceanicola nanhaiensis]
MSISRREALIGVGGAVVGGLATKFAPTSIYHSAPLNVAEYREAARRRLPKIVFDYLDGGAGDELALRRNTEIFDRIEFRPARLKDISKRDISTELFGKTQAAPIMVAPTGLNGSFWPDGDIALAKAAEEVGVPFALSTASTTSMEDVAANAGGDKWFQLYVLSRGIAESLVERALKAGYTKLILTTDVGINGMRYRDARNGFKIPLPISPGLVWDGMTHPAWSLDFVLNGMPEMGNFASADASNTEQQAVLMSRSMDATFDWAALRWLRELWPHELLVKGILRADDAVRCIDNGADAVILSNHGGRQLGDAPAPIQVLAETRARISAPILIDSGYRRGEDIVKALALGADTVLLGKAVLYGLSANGQAGATDVLKILMKEIDNTLAQIQCPNVRDLTPEYVAAVDRSLMGPQGSDSSTS